MNEIETLADFDIFEELSTPQRIPAPDKNHYQIYEIGMDGLRRVGEAEPYEVEDEWS